MDTKNVIYTICAVMFSFIMISPAQSATVEYSVVFDGSISGPAGAGSFQWNSDTNDMTALIWDFGSGLVGGLEETYLDSDFIGGTIGSALFELMTGADTHPNSLDESTLTISDASVFDGSFSGMLINSLNATTNPSRYGFLDENNSLVYEGVFSVISTTVVPLPAGVWLFGSGLLGLIGVARCKKS